MSIGRQNFIEKLKSEKSNFYLLLLFFVVLLVLIISFAGKYLIFGGEGNYFLNLLSVKHLYDFSWIPINSGTGSPNPILNFSFGVMHFFYWLQWVGLPYKIINVLAVFLVYALPFLAMFWVLKRVLRNSFNSSFLISLFYIINPFSTFHLQGMMFWNATPFVVIPLAFGIICKYYFQKIRLFIFFGVLTLVFSFSFANIPYLGIFHIAILIFLAIITFYQEGEFKIKGFLSRFLIVESSFMAFNAWWMFNLIRFQLQDLSTAYTNKFAVGWAMQANGDGGIVGKIFSLKTLSEFNSGYFFSDFYNNNFISIILFVPFLIIIFSLARSIKIVGNKTNHRVYLSMVGSIIIVFFLTKGFNDPLKNLYILMMNNIPFFIIFKSPLEKFSVLLVFLMSISLAHVIVVKNDKIFRYAFVFYLVICSVPFAILNFIPDVQFRDNKFISRKYLDKEEYFETRESINNDKLDYRYLSLPGSKNYQVTVLNHENKYYRGMDPLVYAINKPFIAAYSHFLVGSADLIFNNFSNNNIEDILNLYNVKKVVINKDIYPAFGFREKEDVDELINIFSKNDELNSNGSLHIFTKNDFSPHLYIPRNSIVSGRSIKDLPKILSDPDWQIRSAVFFREQNDGKEGMLNKISNFQFPISSQYQNSNDQNVNNTIQDGNDDCADEGCVALPTIEFKKINPTKYRVRVHGAEGVFPVVFSESYHDGWKSYLVKSAPSSPQPSPRAGEGAISDYKILDGNVEDQATKDELRDFIQKGYVTTLGDSREKTIEHMKWEDGKEKLDYVEKYRIDFVSKNFQGTIQNDNLPKGNIFETWLQKPIENNANHLMANGYANSWVIDANLICNPAPSSPTSSATPSSPQPSPRAGEGAIGCIKNPDGSYDFELVVEFWPQRLFYGGLFISGVTLFGCLVYLGYDWRNRRKSEGAGPSDKKSKWQAMENE